MTLIDGVFLGVLMAFFDDVLVPCSWRVDGVFFDDVFSFCFDGVLMAF